MPVAERHAPQNVVLDLLRHEWATAEKLANDILETTRPRPGQMVRLDSGVTYVFEAYVSYPSGHTGYTLRRNGAKVNTRDWALAKAIKQPLLMAPTRAFIHTEHAQVMKKFQELAARPMDQVYADAHRPAHGPTTPAPAAPEPALC